MTQGNSFDTAAHRLLEDLDSRHDQILSELDALNSRVDQVLSLYTKVIPDAPVVQDDLSEVQDDD